MQFYDNIKQEIYSLCCDGKNY